MCGTDGTNGASAANGTNGAANQVRHIHSGMSRLIVASGLIDTTTTTTTPLTP
jgi:hypothetical protein